MAELRRRFALFPKHDGKGKIIVQYQDGSEEILSYLDAAVQEEGWRNAVRAAGVFLAMNQRKD